MGYASNKGAAKLGAVLSRQARKVSERNGPPLDFGVIQDDYSLKLNNFEKPLPKGMYSVCRRVTLGGTALKPGDRVIAAWVGNEAVVLDIVLKS